MPTSDAQGAATRLCKSRRSGFTLVEMVSVLVIFTILALVALPRFLNQHQAFDLRISSDQAQSMLRHAQKIAIAQNRNVHVRLDGHSVAFCFAAFVGGVTCGNPVPAPGGRNSSSAATLARCNNSNTWFCEAVPDGVSYGAASAFYFNALGQPFYPADAFPISSFARLDLALSGGGATRHVFVEAETGYVHP